MADDDRYVRNPIQGVWVDAISAERYQPFTKNCSIGTVRIEKSHLVNLPLADALGFQLKAYCPENGDGAINDFTTVLTLDKVHRNDISVEDIVRRRRGRIVRDRVFLFREDLGPLTTEQVMVLMTYVLKNLPELIAFSHWQPYLGEFKNGEALERALGREQGYLSVETMNHFLFENNYYELMRVDIPGPLPVKIDRREATKASGKPVRSDRKQAKKADKKDKKCTMM